MKHVNFFSVFTVVLIVGLGVIFALPHASNVIASIPGVNFGNTKDKVNTKNTDKTSDEVRVNDESGISQPTAPTIQNQPTAKSEDGVSISQADKEAETYYSTGLPILIGVYAAQSKVYINSAQQWNGFVATYSDIKDPRTNVAPVYTSQAPKVGEIQIISPGQCSKLGELQTSTTQRTYAFRVLIGSRYMCHYNLGGAVYAR